MPNECLCGTWRKLLGVNSFQVWKAESEFILINDFISFHLPVTILLGKTGVLFLPVCAKSRFWQLQTKADEETAPLEAFPLIRSRGSLHSYQGIFLSKTVQRMLVFPSDPLVWSEIPDGCKPVLLFLPERFSVISNISHSLELILSFYHVRSGLINSRLQDRLLTNTFLF